MSSYNIPGYYLRETLGKGAFGTVKVARNIKTRNEVAIKVIENDTLGIVSESGGNQFLDELLMWEGFDHPHIIKLFYIINSYPYTCVMIELADNQTLGRLIRRKKLKCKEGLFFFVQVVSALQYLHRRNICHRDIKADNVLLQNEIICKLCDFGFSAKCNDDNLQTQYCGTSFYLAPEIIQTYDEESDECSYNGKQTDMWAMGVLFYVLLAHKLPFNGLDNDHTFYMITRCMYREIEGTPIECKNILRGLLELNTTKRLKVDDLMENTWLDEMCKYNLVTKHFDEIVEESSSKALDMYKVENGNIVLFQKGREERIRCEANGELRCLAAKITKENILKLIQEHYETHIEHSSHNKSSNENRLTKMKRFKVALSTLSNKLGFRRNYSLIIENESSHK